MAWPYMRGLTLIGAFILGVVMIVLMLLGAAQLAIDLGIGR